MEIARPSRKAGPKPVKRKTVTESEGELLKKLPKLPAYELPDIMTRSLADRLPSGVRIALVATGKEAERELREVVTAGPEKLERVVSSSWRSRSSSRAEIEPSAFAPNARARALLRGRSMMAADLREAGGAYDMDEVLGLLNGISRQALERRVRQGELLAVPGPSNRRRYPAAQFSADGVVPGLKRIQETLPTRNPWAVLNFLVRPDERLGGRKPIDVLRQGEVDLVVSAARGVGVQGG